MTAQAQPSRGRNRLILLLIVGLFVGPIVIAWLYVRGVLDWHDQGLVNYGTLISPPIDLTQLGDFPSVHALSKRAPSEWAIVVIEPDECEQACAAVLDKMLIVRELLGQGADRVSVQAIAAGSEHQGRHVNRIHRDPAGITALTAAIASNAPQVPLPLIALVARGELMMVYPVNSPQRNIQEDLKRLLIASKLY